RSELGDYGRLTVDLPKFALWPGQWAITRHLNPGVASRPALGPCFEPFPHRGIHWLTLLIFPGTQSCLGPIGRPYATCHTAPDECRQCAARNKGWFKENDQHNNKK